MAKRKSLHQQIMDRLDEQDAQPVTGTCADCGAPAPTGTVRADVRWTAGVWRCRECFRAQSAKLYSFPLLPFKGTETQED
jgi:hypothetical protein